MPSLLPPKTDNTDHSFILKLSLMTNMASYKHFHGKMSFNGTAWSHGRFIKQLNIPLLLNILQYSLQSFIVRII